MKLSEAQKEQINAVKTLYYSPGLNTFLDAGSYVHIVSPKEDPIDHKLWGQAICGASAMPRSDGWKKTERPVTCPRCIGKQNASSPQKVKR